MTPQEIDALEAGRELDALIAENVMGWHLLDGKFWVNEHGERTGWDFDLQIEDGRNDFSPSQDIAAAWAIVEKHPHYFSLTRSNNTNWQPAPFGPIVWRCRFYAPEKFEAVADTAPLAICRAALKAVLPTA